MYKSPLPVYCLREKENDVMYKGARCETETQLHCILDVLIK